MARCTALLKVTIPIAEHYSPKRVHVIPNDVAIGQEVSMLSCGLRHILMFPSA